MWTLTQAITSEFELVNFFSPIVQPSSWQLNFITEHWFRTTKHRFLVMNILSSLMNTVFSYEYKTTPSTRRYLRIHTQFFGHIFLQMTKKPISVNTDQFVKMLNFYYTWIEQLFTRLRSVFNNDFFLSGYLRSKV